MELRNDLLLRTIRGEKTERTPVWLMRQAGRILPEYRALRNKLSGFKELVETPELAAEVTIQPVDHLDVDAAIIFSDILVIPEAMGLPYDMVEKRGPLFRTTIATESDINKLHVAEGGDIQYTLDAIQITKKELNGRVPLIGFAGAPWTIFAYMVEGSGSKTFSRARAMLYREPELAHRLLQMITDSTINYLHAQVEAGADVLQVFDSWAGILPPNQYEEFSLFYLHQICAAIQDTPLTVFAKDVRISAKKLNELDCETIGLDWCMNPATFRQEMPGKVLQGNLDPCVLYGSPDVIMEETRRMLINFGTKRHIANLGHGVYPDISPEAVKTFISVVKEYSAELR
ncbi:uroporphyrinogen decarboxylase [Fulvivirga sedimenti]|uniref:Uroporphyrinogen decarboxylase n=1 Tax=Fulvivirga sedimenti TaxID=2879465 RepID=A0A9X1KYS2_9BACT|nr:uroporphyrinogen decarboxylase [Fulvivirga sedimenti]MCA6078198.1 uroporphyrinogen decarboxylase [Fulvivirga sedimenti]